MCIWFVTTFVVKITFQWHCLVYLSCVFFFSPMELDQFFAHSCILVAHPHGVFDFFFLRRRNVGQALSILRSECVKKNPKQTRAKNIFQYCPFTQEATFNRAAHRCHVSTSVFYLSTGLSIIIQYTAQVPKMKTNFGVKTKNVHVVHSWFVSIFSLQVQFTSVQSTASLTCCTCCTVYVCVSRIMMFVAAHPQYKNWKKKILILSWQQ